MGAPLFRAWRGLPLALDGLSFLISAVLLAAIGPVQADEPVAKVAAWAAAAGAPATGRPARGLLSTVRHGLAELVGSRLLLAFTCLATAINFVFMGQIAVLAPLVLHVMRLPSSVYGGFLVASAVGAVLGGLLAARLARAGEGRVLLLCLSGFALASAAIGSSPAAIAGVCFLLSGAMVSVYNAIAMSLRQRIVPAEVLGTVTGAYRMITWGSMPVGAAVYGLLAGAWGLRWTFFAGGALVAATTLGCSGVLRKIAPPRPARPGHLEPARTR